MAKYEEVFEETQAMYTQAITASGIGTNVNITILSNNKAKDIFKVKKADDILNYRTNDDVIIIINEKIFEQLTEEQRKIVVEESLAPISYDLDKGKLEIKTPDISAFSGILSKYTFKTILTLRESIKTLYAVEKEEEEKRKNAKTKGAGKQAV